MCEAKCCEEQIRGLVLHDSHAEVLARRGLINVLWDEIIYHLKYRGESGYEERAQKGLLRIIPDQNDIKNNVERAKEDGSQNSGNVCFELKENIQLHLYISDSPCGDASIYNISSKYASNTNNENENENENENGLNFTGAKIIVPEGDKVDTDNFSQCSSSNSKPQVGILDAESVSNLRIVREKIQITSALRIKSGRSNIPEHLRSSSMSCSDKICKWIITGVQGCGALARLLPKCIRLSSVVVSRDPRVEEGDIASNLDSQLCALKRALISRAEDAISALNSSSMDDCKYNKIDLKLPDVAICDHIFHAGKAVMDKQRIDELNTSLIDSTTVVATLKVPEDDEEIKSAAVQVKNKRKADSGSCHRERECKRQKGQKLASCGISLNWQNNVFLQTKSNRRNDIEQTVGAKGIVQRKKPKCLDDVMKCSSRLSRYSLWKKIFEALTLSKLLTSEFSPGQKMISYQRTKEMYAPPDIRKLMHRVLCDTRNPLKGWVKNSAETDFYPHNCE